MVCHQYGLFHVSSSHLMFCVGLFYVSSNGLMLSISSHTASNWMVYHQCNLWIHSFFFKLDFAQLKGFFPPWVLSRLLKLLDVRHHLYLHWEQLKGLSPVLVLSCSIISNKLKDFLEKHKGFSNKRPKKPGTIANIDCGFVKNYNFFENWKDPAPLESTG